MNFNFNYPIRNLMRREVISVPVGTSLEKAAEKMVQHRVGSVVVVEGERPVGIVTERNFVRLFSNDRGKKDGVTVNEFIPRKLIHLRSSATFSDAVQAFNHHGIKRVPVVENGRLVGILSQKDLFDFSRQALLATLEKNRQLQGEVYRDPLTSLYNKRFFLFSAKREFNRVSRYGGQSSLLFMDIDHFKQINDTHSHSAGDHVLRMLGRIFKENCRKSDVVARYGGEEFVIITPQLKAAHASLYAEKLRRAVMDHLFVYNGQKITVTVSIGVAAFSSGPAVQKVVENADAALYAAKRGGRNRVCVWMPKAKPV